MTKPQEPTFVCECGNAALVRRGRSPWIFDVNCSCGREYVLAWAQDEPPPDFTRGEQMIDDALKHLTLAMAQREEEYARAVLALRYEFPETVVPAERIEQLMMEAYRDGGRDMYAAVNETLAPLWKQAGIEP